jgi:FAD/FMN-containing dehydrogenase
MSDALVDRLAALIGPAHVLTGADAAAYGTEWTGKYHWTPRAVLRPADTGQVAAIMALAHETRTPVVPVGGRTGITGATQAEGQLMLSLERLNCIHPVNVTARILKVGAGAVLSNIHDAALARDLVFPLTFGARGSAMIGGALSTNAGGSNVVRHGSTRGLCLGVEVVLADGRVLNLLSELRKDNSGYDLRDLFIGAEGTLGIITAAVLRLFPRPRAYATALVGLPALAPALDLLNRLQAASGQAVEAFEFMPATYMARLLRFRPDLTVPLAGDHPVTILAEIAAVSDRDAAPGADGQSAVAATLESVLAGMLDEGSVTDAAVASSEAHRRAMWAIREAAAEVTLNTHPLVDTDIAVPLDRVHDFLTRMSAGLADLDPAATDVVVAHLGDGNIHYTAFPSRDDPALHDAIRAAVDGIAADLGGSFSAEHGIGLSKLPSMRRLKDPVALDVMRAVKIALDPQNILNPGKTLP